MRTQAKPFIVQIKKRKRTGADEPRPVRSLFGPMAKELAEELAQADGLGGSGRGRAGSGAERGAGVPPVSNSLAWAQAVTAANPGSSAASPPPRVLPDLRPQDQAAEREEEEVAEPEPRIRQKRRYTRKAAKQTGPAPAVVRHDVVAPPVQRAPAPETREISSTAKKRVPRERFKWSAWRRRRVKADAVSSAQPARGQRWKRRLPSTAR